MIIGEMSSGMMTARNGKLERLRPSAASVPRHVASTVDAAPMPMLFANARCQSLLPSAFEYQCSEKPCIGYEKYAPELNDNGTMARIGAIRKNRINAECTRSHFDAMRSDNTRCRWLCMMSSLPWRLSKPQPVDTHKPVEHEIEHGREDHEIRRQRARQSPVELLVGLRGDELADHLIAGATEQRGRDVVAEREHEHQETSRADTRQRLRHIDANERCHGMRAERLRRAHIDGRDALHDRVDREDHVRQQDMRHADQNARAVKKQRQWVADDSRTHQQAVDYAARLQQYVPRSRANK